MEFVLQDTVLYSLPGPTCGVALMCKLLQSHYAAVYLKEFRLLADRGFKR
jgi:hypothetical protein